MLQSQKVQVPKPWPKWKKERNFFEYQQNNPKDFTIPEGMTNLQWVESKCRRLPGEPFIDWLPRVSADPILAQLLDTVEVFACKVGDPFGAPLGRIISPIPNLQQGLDWSDAIDKFMFEKIEGLKSIGYLFDQREELRGRYGRSMLAKVIWHHIMLKLGIDSRLELNLKGNSFLLTNTVTPDPNYVKDPRYPCYRERAVGPWPIMVTNHVVNNCIAITDAQFGPIRLPKDATAEDAEYRVYSFKYQVYKAVSLLEIDRGMSQAILRAFTNPKLMFDRGLVERPATETVTSHKKDRKLDASGRSISYMKEVTRKQEKDTGPIREYQAKIDDQTWEPIHLLKKLKGFDPSKIRPQGKQ